MPTRQPIWSPSPERVQRANLSAFIQRIAAFHPSIVDYSTLYRFSVDHIPEFWDALWDYFEIAGIKGSSSVSNADSMLDCRWFPGAKLNFAENHLHRDDDEVAIVAYSEGEGRQLVSWRQLRGSVGRLQAAFRDHGIGPGDRVAACLPNCSEAVIAMLAATSLGAIWSACSPDYGPDAILDRFKQIEPKVLLLADGYTYNGKNFDLREKNAALLNKLPSVSLAILVPSPGNPNSQSAEADCTSWTQLLSGYAGSSLSFERFSFDHPVYILYSSGTTGKPKAILHSAGGSLLQSMKEMALHCDLHRGEPTFFQTTIGWVVWNIMIGSLALGSPIVLYDGAPTYPHPGALFDIIEAEQVAVARIVPPMIDAYLKSGLKPRETHDLNALRCILAGSAPLLPQHYAYVYRQIKEDLHLMSPSGGTDLMGSLVSGDPTGAVYPGEIQVRSLGMMVEVYDPAGHSIVGSPGELVCTRPFPSVPLKFWGDKDRERVRQQYFSVYPGVWRHGDWAEITPDGATIIHGRSDATLNINGVRIGTAEIYRSIEGFTEIKEAVAVSQRRGDNERIVLLVVMSPGTSLDEILADRIRKEVRNRATARHVPAKIIEVPDLLRSLNGKPSEIAIRELINGRALSNSVGLSNPEIIEVFSDMAELSA